MFQITRKQFQAAVQAGIDATEDKLPDEVVNRLKLAAAVDNYTSVRRFTYDHRCKCPVESAQVRDILDDPEFILTAWDFIMTFDRCASTVVGKPYYSGPLEVI